MDTPLTNIAKQGRHYQSFGACESSLKFHRGTSAITDDEQQCGTESCASNVLDSDNARSFSADTDLSGSINSVPVHNSYKSVSSRKESIGTDVSERRSSRRSQKVYRELPPRVTKGCAFVHPTFGFFTWTRVRQISRRQSSASRSSNVSFWRGRVDQRSLTQHKISSAGRNQEKLCHKDICSISREEDSDQIEKYDELRKPLSRKLPIPPSRINPNRVSVIFRIIILAFFLQYRLTNPVENAYGLWLTSVICETWFSLSWFLELLPKWKPIKRETYLSRLYLRFNNPGEPCEMACIDVFISTVDPMKEPPLVTSNTVLSVLAVDYPAERVTCYVSDDGASILTLEVLKETCQFARAWVPFCKKFNIEPRAPEYYFSLKVDHMKYNIFPTFVKERRTMKRQYEEFKVRINSLIGTLKNVPCDGWVMADGNPWPGNDAENHPAILQVLLGHSEPSDDKYEELPQLIYVSREKRPDYQDNKTAGALNSLVRVSAILTNGDYVLNLNCDHYINNSKAFQEAMCFMMDESIAQKTCFVQFPRRFDAGAIFDDVNLKCLDGVQGPFYVGTGCFLNRTALYGYDPSLKTNSSVVSLQKPEKEKFNIFTYATAADLEANMLYNADGSGFELEYPSLFLRLKQYFGESLSLIDSIIVKRDGFARPAESGNVLKEAIQVLSCGYEENTAWGIEVGWIYGSNMLMGLKMHARGWRSIYCTPLRPAFIGHAPIDLSDHLNRLFHLAIDCTQILFSSQCPIWYAYGSKLRWLERIAYINAAVYPLQSIPVVVYCTLPAICLLTGKFVYPPIASIGYVWFALILVSSISTVVLEMRWSGIGIEEWWRRHQYWVIGGVSCHLSAVIYAPVKIFARQSAKITSWTDKLLENEFSSSYSFRWTSLMVIPTLIILINLCAIVAGVSSSMRDQNGSWSLLFVKMFFSMIVLIHLYPFIKSWLIHHRTIPTVVAVWSLLLASLFSMLWIRDNPFVTRFTGPNVQDCGIYC